MSTTASSLREFSVAQLSLLFFTSRQVHAKSSPSKAWYLDWLNICKWTAEEAEELPHTAPSVVILPCRMWQNHIWSHNCSTENTESLIKSTLCLQEAEEKTLAPKMMHTVAEHAHRKGASGREGHYRVQHRAWTEHRCLKQIALEDPHPSLCRKKLMEKLYSQQGWQMRQNVDVLV